MFHKFKVLCQVKLDKKDKSFMISLYMKSLGKTNKQTNKTKQNQTHSDRDTVRLGKIDEGD